MVCACPLVGICLRVMAYCSCCHRRLPLKDIKWLYDGKPAMVLWLLQKRPRSIKTLQKLTDTPNEQTMETHVGRLRLYLYRYGATIRIVKGKHTLQELHDASKENTDG